jgi:hypothetical protein
MFTRGLAKHPCEEGIRLYGLAVGSIHAYPLLMRPSKGGPFANQTTVVSWIAYTIDQID